MSLEENKAVVRMHITEVLEKGHVELIDRYYAPDGSEPDSQTPQQWRESVLWHHKNAPGFKCTILKMIAEGDEVAVYTQVDITYLTGDQDNSQAHPPLGQPITWRNLTIMRIVGGKLVSEVGLWGWNDMLVKVGVLVPRISTAV